MELDLGVVVALLISGILVGFINTLAGGATIISMSVFMLLGLPVTVANGTNRIAVVLQNLTSSINFIRNGLLDVKLGLKLGAPMIIGAVVGSSIASRADEATFKISLGIVLILVLGFMLLSNPKRFAKPSAEKGTPHFSNLNYLWLLIAGFYSGYIYVGLGYIILLITMASMRLDIVRANALKCFMVLVSTPFSLLVFMINGQVCYAYGLIHAIGNILGAFLASQYGIGWGVRFLKWLLVGFILITMFDMFGIIDFKSLLYHLLK